MLKITLKTTNQQIKLGTKTVWEDIKEATEQVTKEQHNNATSDDTIKWFRRLGGSETATYSYTTAGYLVTKLVSTSPDKQNRTIREYTFENVPDTYNAKINKLGYGNYEIKCKIGDRGFKTYTATNKRDAQRILRQWEAKKEGYEL